MQSEPAEPLASADTAVHSITPRLVSLSDAQARQLGFNGRCCKRSTKTLLLSTLKAVGFILRAPDATPAFLD